MGHPVESWNTLNIPDGKKELGEEEGEDDPREVLLGPRLDARPLQLDLQPSVVQQGQSHHRLQDLVPVGGEREQPSGRIGKVMLGQSKLTASTSFFLMRSDTTRTCRGTLCARCDGA